MLSLYEKFLNNDLTVFQFKLLVIKLGDAEENMFESQWNDTNEV